jgi:SPP1 family predicted phage head-tail adaptor
MTATALPIGRLATVLTIERATVGADDTVAWTALATVHAALDPISSDEAERGAAIGGLTRWRIEIRFRTDLSSRDRLRRGERIFRIVALRDLDGCRRRLVVVAEEEEP